MTAIFEKGREGFLDGSIDWDTNTIKAILLDLDTPDTGVKAITGATNATPIVVTATAHGFSNGDIVVIDKVGGNLAANGIYKVANVATNTFELQTLAGVNVVGFGAYTSGGYAVCLGPSASGDNLDDIDGCIVGSAVTLTSPTVTQGVAGATIPAFASVSGATVEGIATYKDTGTASTSRLISLHIGKINVIVAADAASSATVVWVYPLEGPIASGTVLTFSNGKQATLSAPAAEGATSLTVSALANAISAGHQALAPVTGSGFPLTPNGNNITVTLLSTPNKFFKL
jgi:hypothetical protein